MLNNESCDIKSIFYKEVVSFATILLFCDLVLLLRYLYGLIKSSENSETLYLTAKDKLTKITRKRVKEWLSAQPAYTLHRPARRN